MANLFAFLYVLSKEEFRNWEWELEFRDSAKKKKRKKHDTYVLFWLPLE